MELKVGDKITITVEATITDVSNAHGLCYEVELPQKDFNHSRLVWIDENEINKNEKG